MLSRFERFLCSINEIDLYLHRLTAAEMKPYGLKGNVAIYFTQLNSAPDGLTASELCTSCGRDKADVSRDVSMLAKAGLVTRSGGYRARIRLTDEGRRITQEIIRKAECAVSLVGQNLTEEERE